MFRLIAEVEHLSSKSLPWTCRPLLSTDRKLPSAQLLTHRQSVPNYPAGSEDQRSRQLIPRPIFSSHFGLHYPRTLPLSSLKANTGYLYRLNKTSGRTCVIEGFSMLTENCFFWQNLKEIFQDFQKNTLQQSQITQQLVRSAEVRK